MFFKDPETPQDHFENSETSASVSCYIIRFITILNLCLGTRRRRRDVSATRAPAPSPTRTQTARTQRQRPPAGARHQVGQAWWRVQDFLLLGGAGGGDTGRDGKKSPAPFYSVSKKSK